MVVDGMEEEIVVQMSLINVKEFVKILLMMLLHMIVVVYHLVMLHYLVGVQKNKIFFLELKLTKVFDLSKNKK